MKRRHGVVYDAVTAAILVGTTEARNLGESVPGFGPWAGRLGTTWERGGIKMRQPEGR